MSPNVSRKSTFALHIRQILKYISTSAQRLERLIHALRHTKATEAIAIANDLSA